MQNLKLKILKYFFFNNPNGNFGQSYVNYSFFLNTVFKLCMKLGYLVTAENMDKQYLRSMCIEIYHLHYINFQNNYKNDLS